MLRSYRFLAELTFKMFFLIQNPHQKIDFI